MYRVKPRTNLDVNKWWISDEVRYGWKFIHSPQRLTMPRVKDVEKFDSTDPINAPMAWDAAYETLHAALSEARKPAAMISPMLSCEDAFLLANFVLSVNANATLALGPVPMHGEDKTFPGGFKMHAEKAPNAQACGACWPNSPAARPSSSMRCRPR